MWVKKLVQLFADKVYVYVILSSTLINPPYVILPPYSDPPYLSLHYSSTLFIPSLTL